MSKPKPTPLAPVAPDPGVVYLLTQEQRTALLEFFGRLPMGQIEQYVLMLRGLPKKV